MNTLHVYFTYSECQDVVTQMHNSSGKRIEGMYFCIGSLMYLIIVYTQSLSKMLDILCVSLLGLFQEAVARNKK